MEKISDPYKRLSIVEAFPFDTAPQYLIRDRDGTYGERFRRRVRSLDIEEVITAPRSPWQNTYVERVIGTLRRECLDNVIVLHEWHLRSILGSYIDFYHRRGTFLVEDKLIAWLSGRKLSGVNPWEDPINTELATQDSS